MGNRQDNRVRSPAPDRDHRSHDVRPCSDRVGPSGAVCDRGDDRSDSVGGEGLVELRKSAGGCALDCVCFTDDEIRRELFMVLDTGHRVNEVV